MPDLPHGTVTFLFTDIEGSTRLWQAHPAEMAEAMVRHDALLRETIEERGGGVFKTVGDAVYAAFPAAPAALDAALAAQRALLAEEWPEVGPLRVRMALHTGQAAPHDGDYRGQTLNRLARLLATAHGGQVVLSLPTAELVRDALPAGAALCDLGELPLKDLDRPERAVQLLHPDLPVAFPPPQRPADPSHNLPTPPTPFLGREADLARVTALLQDPAVRLVTVTGPGGIGKTRLALRIAAELREVFPDGVWFVGLAPITDPDLVLPTVARVLGIRPAGDRLVDEVLPTALRDQRLLLLLDNLEQVVEAAPQVADLLAACPGLSVLVTSRMRLRLSGEREYALAPLGLPGSNGALTPEQVAGSEAGRLFVDRAQGVKADFALTQDNAWSVAEICRRLDGLPLAIELAAARVKIFPPQALLARLERRLPLLTGGARDAPTRQQTMRDAIAWSYDLLSGEEQTLFRHLAVFAGGCSFEAIEAVAVPDGLDAVEGVASLVDKSLLRQMEKMDGEPRYRMLETIREFALERLEAAREAEPVRDRHAAWSLALAERTAPLMFGTQPHRWFAHLEREHGNLRAALVWFEQTGDADRLLRLARALGYFWEMNGYWTEGPAWLERALATDAPPSLARAAALHSLGMSAAYVGDFARAEPALREALAVFREEGSASNVADALISLGSMAVDQGGCDAGEALLIEAVEEARRAGDRRLEADAVTHRGIAIWGRGDAAGATAHLEAGRALGQEGGSPLAAAVASRYLAHIAVAAGDFR
ncbi:MAG: NB-ARC domain-containing protein [Chloroflexota bacterium]|nr:NB-ARC domain-containing protein [Chloroflexota bacterium]